MLEMIGWRGGGLIEGVALLWWYSVAPVTLHQTHLQEIIIMIVIIIIEIIMMVT